MEKVKSIIQRKDMSIFQQFLDSLKDDLNRFIVEDNEEATKLNLLHILAGIKPAASSMAFLEACTRLLLEQPGLDINCTGIIDHNYGITAAHIAVQWHNLPVLQLLIKYDADLLICDSNGQNTQDYAMKESDGKMIEAIETGIRRWFTVHSDLYSTVLEWPISSQTGAPFRCHESGSTVVSFLEELAPKAATTCPRNRLNSTSSFRTQNLSPRSSISNSEGSTTTNLNKTWCKAYSSVPYHSDTSTTTTSNNNSWLLQSPEMHPKEADLSAIDHRGTSAASWRDSTNEVDWNITMNTDFMNNNREETTPDKGDWTADSTTAAGDNHNWTSGDQNWTDQPIEITSSWNDASKETTSSWNDPPTNELPSRNDNATNNWTDQPKEETTSKPYTSSWNGPLKVNTLFLNSLPKETTSKPYTTFWNDQQTNESLSRNDQPKVTLSWDDAPKEMTSSCNDPPKETLSWDDAPKEMTSSCNDPPKETLSWDDAPKETTSSCNDPPKETTSSWNDPPTNDWTSGAPAAEKPTESWTANTNQEWTCFNVTDKQQHHKEKTDVNVNRLSGASDVSYMPSVNTSLDSQATEVYLYKDDAFKIELLEERYDGAPRLIDEQQRQVNERTRTGSALDGALHEAAVDGGGTSASSFNRSTDSVESTIDELILKMTNTQLYKHLVDAGQKPGPITEVTKRLYQKKANRLLKMDTQTVVRTLAHGTPSKYSLMDAILDEINDGRKTTKRRTDHEEEQLYMKLTNYPLEFTNLVKKKFPFEEAIAYESMLIKEFDDTDDEVLIFDDGIGGFKKKKTTTSARNTYFSYLLLDPEITNNLPERANLCLEKMLVKGGGGGTTIHGGGGGGGGGLLELLDPKLFASFILAIFYVGKGHNARAYQHFYEAFKAMYPSPSSSSSSPSSSRQPTTTSTSSKTERICSIWKSSKGPISLHCFQGISESEALTREALMIEVLSLSNLTNHISGSYRCSLQLNKRQRSILGTYLLFKAFIILLLNGERQVKLHR